MNEYLTTNKLRATLNAEEHKSTIDEPFEMIADDLHHESSRIWNSVEVHDLHVSYNGVSLSRRQLVKSLERIFWFFQAMVSPAYMDLRVKQPDT